MWLCSRFRDTPVVKSSSRELCYIILAGICLGYLCTFSLIAKPHVIHCYLQRLGIGLSPAMSYSALVTKVRTELGICQLSMSCEVHPWWEVIRSMLPCLGHQCLWGITTEVLQMRESQRYGYTCGWKQNCGPNQGPSPLIQRIVILSSQVRGSRYG